MMDNDNNWDIFISYSHADSDFVDKLEKRLKRLRSPITNKAFKIFRDTKSISIGSNWFINLNKGITSSSKFLIILSPDYFYSEICQWEAISALVRDPLQRHETIIPIMHRMCKMPFGIDQLQYVNFRIPSDFNKSFNILASALKNKKRPEISSELNSNINIITLEENVPLIEINLVFQGSGRVLRCKVPSNIITAILIKQIAKQFNITQLDSDDVFIEYFLYDLDRHKRIEPSETLEEYSYSNHSTFSINLFRKKKPSYPRIGLHFNGAKKCFPDSTKVKMADGFEKNVNQVVPGERLYSYDIINNKLSISNVVEITTGKVGGLICINNLIFCSSGQTIYTDRGILTFEQIKIGDYIFQFPNLKAIRINKIDVILKRFKVYNLVINPLNNFFANGFLVEDQIGLPDSESFLLLRKAEEQIEM